MGGFDSRLRVPSAGPSFGSKSGVMPPIPQRRLPALTDAIWQPIDRALECGLNGPGIRGDWNQRLRDAARADAAKGAIELFDQTMDAAQITGETREAVGTDLRAAMHLEVPF